jgi:hypothetical protein
MYGNKTATNFEQVDWISPEHLRALTTGVRTASVVTTLTLALVVATMALDMCAVLL